MCDHEDGGAGLSGNIPDKTDLTADDLGTQLQALGKPST